MRLKQRAAFDAQPLSALLELTYRCNWRCVFCYNPRHTDYTAIGAREWVCVLDGLRELGTLFLTLTGGEPLTHPAFFEVAEAARSRGMALRIFTNGALVDDDRARRIAALNPLGVELSLHGATAEVHDATTGRSGSFDEVFRAVDVLQCHGVPLLLKTPLTNRNEHQLEEMIALAASRGVPYNVDPTIQPRDDGDTGPLAYAASRDAIARMMRIPELAARMGTTDRRLGGVNCGLGRTTVAIDPEGNVYPCPQWRHTSLGNVRVQPIQAIWRESEERQRAAEVARQSNDALVQRGGAVASFAFCPASAFTLTGSATTPDTITLERARLVAELRSGR